MTRSALRSLTAAALLSTVAWSGAVWAGDASGAEKFRKMDTNSDGRLSSAEHDAGARMMFKKMDANSDGSVTAAEMEASHKMMKDGMKSDRTHSHDMKKTKPMPAAAADGN